MNPFLLVFSGQIMTSVGLRLLRRGILWELFCCEPESFGLSSCSVVSAVEVAGDATLCVEWSSPSPVTDLALLGNTRTCLARRLVLTAPLGSLDWSEVLLLLPMTPVVLPSHFSMIPPLARDTAPGSPLPPPSPGVSSRVH
ncbi:unnamed protein product [Arctogadus glacialis]